MSETIKVHVQQSMSHFRVDFYVAAHIGLDGRPVSVAAPPTFEPYTELTPAEPTFSTSPEQAQALMDALWDIGIRPTAGHGSVGALKQAEDHIQTLRHIAYALVAKPAAPREEA